MSLKLKQYLFVAYEGFGDKRIKDIKKDYPFKLDDQSDSDKHYQFCGIFAQVTDNDKFILSLTNKAPHNPAIEKLVTSKGGLVRIIENSSHIEIELNARDYKFIRKLAQYIRNLVAPRIEYQNPNWKWLCPRTADSLDKFATILEEYCNA